MQGYFFEIAGIELLGVDHGAGHMPEDLEFAG
jgi:hypothetical protein